MDYSKDAETTHNPSIIKPESLDEAVFEMESNARQFNGSISNHIALISNSTNEIRDELIKENRSLNSMEGDLGMLKNEVLKSNFRLDTLEMELKNFRKDFNSKTDFMIAKFNQMVDLLAKIAHGH